MQGFRIAAKLTIASVATVLALLAIVAVALLGLRQQRTTADGVIARAARERLAAEVRTGLDEIHGGTYRVITWTVAGYERARIEKAKKQQLEAVSDLQRRVDSAAKSPELAEEERARFQPMGGGLTKYRQKMEMVLDMAEGDIATATMYMTNADQAYQALSAELAELTALEQRLSAEQNARSEQAFGRVVAMLLGAAVIAGSLATGLSVVLARSIGLSIRALAGEAGRLSDAIDRGDLAVRAEPAVVGADFAPVASAMNTTMDAFVRPMSLAAEYVARIAKGDVPERIREPYQGDFEVLRTNLNQCIGAIEALVEDAGTLAQAAVEGKLSVRADPARHEGEFRRIIVGVNDTLDAVIGPLGVAAVCLQAIADGDIPAPIAEEYRGDFDTIKTNLNRCIEAVNALVSDVNGLARAGVEGRLSTRADAGRHRGDFRRIVEGVNATLDGVVGPLRTAAGYMDRISRGEIPPPIAETYPGDFDALKGSLNRCIGAVNALVADAERLVGAAVGGTLAVRADAARHEGDFRKVVEGVNRTLDALIAPVEEAARTLERLADRDLRARMTGRYEGDHARLEGAVNATAGALHDALVQVAGAAEQVSSAATQIASSSQSVAGGASEQAGAITRVGTTLEAIAGTSRESVASAQQARTLATAAQASAGEGTVAMTQMQGAMERIRTSAEGTSQILRDINEIAFQTNLLALNAAVEAARAGEAGRGFAVVAEEVRSLALRSKDAAMKTEGLIRQSVREAEEGSATSRQVNDRLSQIVEAVGKVSGIVGEITAAADSQSQGLQQVAEAVAQMDRVTQQNAASAEQSSSAAEELSSQSEELAAMVATFQFEQAGSARPARASPRLGPAVPFPGGSTGSSSRRRRADA